MVEDIHVISAGMINFMNSGTKDEWALRSYFGRVNYAFDGKYLFEANLRADGTSRFAKGNRWDIFHHSRQDGTFHVKNSWSSLLRY